MKVIRTFDKATQKTHVTTISLISNQGPTVSEYDELPNIPAASVSTVKSIDSLSDRINKVGNDVVSYMYNMASGMAVLANKSFDDTVYTGENPPVNVFTAVLNQKDTPITMSGILGNYKILRVSLQATTALNEDAVVSIEDNTNNATIALFDYNMFDEGLTYNSPVSIIIPDNCEILSICSNTDIPIYVSILYMKR